MGHRTSKRLSRKALLNSYLAACRFDVIALKPGNVSILQAGHNMVAEQFLAAARVSGPEILAAKSIGNALYQAVRASVAVAGCNTNLGIVLLATPLLKAAQASNDDTADSDLRSTVAALIDEATVDDTVRTFQAIQVAEPGGLGRSSEHDVADTPDIPLKEVMIYAADRDRISAQYANKFADIFTIGVPIFQHFVQRWESAAWACVAVYLTFMANFRDTHIARKFGDEQAESIRQDAVVLERAFKACENPARFASSLLEFDAVLKRGGVNPGTSADLTVASLLACWLQASQ